MFQSLCSLFCSSFCRMFSSIYSKSINLFLYTSSFMLLYFYTFSFILLPLCFLNILWYHEHTFVHCAKQKFNLIFKRIFINSVMEISLHDLKYPLIITKFNIFMFLFLDSFLKIKKKLIHLPRFTPIPHCFNYEVLVKFNSL